MALLLILVSGCNSKLTEEQAKSIVLEHHSSNIGEIRILSVTQKFGEYKIEWENQENCESGIDSVNRNGEIEIAKASIC